MRVPRIYTSQALKPGDQVELEAGASHHVSKVLRMTIGRELLAFNGDGKEYPSVITQLNKKSVVISVADVVESSRQSPLILDLAISLSKGDRFEWVLQKATELGVTSITPVITERTEVKLSGERLEKKMASWLSIIIGACEQCQRNILPQLHPPKTISDFVQHSDAQYKFVLHHRSDKNFASFTDIKSLALLIGPEGGLSDDEITLALQKEFLPLTLGPRVMRTETAPVAAIAIAQMLWGDFA